MSSIMMVAGEASGDLHGARLLSQARRLLPELSAFGMGGQELAAAGLERLADSSAISVVGIAEAFKILPTAWRIMKRLVGEAERRRPAAAVLIDAPDFNLRLAEKLTDRGIPVIYYISPQIWAWRRGRVKAIARVVDEMLVLFPFEVDFYRGHGIEVRHVGHPLVDEVPRLPHIWERGVPEGEPFRLALLPGSRNSELDRLLPTMLASARLLAERLPLQVRLIRAATVDRGQVERLVQESGLTVETVAAGDRFDALAGSHLAFCASGTATLEVGLLGTPLLVIYRLKLLSYLLGRLLVRLPSFSLVNLVLERPAVPELLQRGATPERIAAAAEELLGDPERIAAMRRDLGGLRQQLGQGGASRRAAEAVVAFVTGGAPREGSS